MKKNHDVKSGEWAKHLRPIGKRFAAKKSRRNGIAEISEQEIMGDMRYCSNVFPKEYLKLEIRHSVN